MLCLRYESPPTLFPCVHVSNFQPVLRFCNLCSCVFLVLWCLEASCDNSYCDRSLLLHCSPKCTRCCYSTRAWSVCPPQWSAELTARGRISLNELCSWNDCWSASLSSVCLCSSSMTVSVAAQLAVLHFACTQDLITPLPCPTLLSFFLSLLCENKHALLHFGGHKYQKTQTLFDIWGGCVSNKTHHIHSGDPGSRAF